MESTTDWWLLHLWKAVVSRLTVKSARSIEFAKCRATTHVVVSLPFHSVPFTQDHRGMQRGTHNQFLAAMIANVRISEILDCRTAGNWARAAFFVPGEDWPNVVNKRMEFHLYGFAHYYLLYLITECVFLDRLWQCWKIRLSTSIKKNWTGLSTISV